MHINRTNKVASVYFIAASAWIIGSDTIAFLYSFSNQYPFIQSFKGLIFVTATTFILYTLLHKWEKKLHQSHHEYLNLFFENPTPMWVCRQDNLQILAVNQSAIHKYGYSQTDYLGKSVTLLCRPEDKDSFIHLVRNHKNESKIFLLRNADQELFYVLLRCHPTIFNEKPAFILMGSNIHQEHLAKLEISNLNKKLVKRNQNLKKTNHELDAFVYRVSHDLRAPISSALGLIQISKLENSLEKIMYYLDLQEASLKKLDKFIQDILHFSRNARQEVKPTYINLEGMINEIISSLQNGTTEVNVKVVIKQEAALICDEMRIRIILNNLISNSFKYIDPGKDEPKIKIQASIQPLLFKLKIEDNGIGIAKEHQQKVFDMFFRASQLHSGSGLGLYIVKEIVNKLDGDIRINSELGVGTTFRIKIPNKTNV